LDAAFSYGAVVAARSGQSRATGGAQANPCRDPKSEIVEKKADQAAARDPEGDPGADESISLHGVAPLRWRGPAFLGRQVQESSIRSACHDRLDIPADEIDGRPALEAYPGTLHGRH
jgi:hypothetical protein